MVLVKGKSYAVFDTDEGGHYIHFFDFSGMFYEDEKFYVDKEDGNATYARMRADGFEKCHLAQLLSRKAYCLEG